MVSSISEFLDVLSENNDDSSLIYSYRGHSKTSYKLQPSVFRALYARKSERNIIRELITMHPDEFRSDVSTLEILVRMQHFSLPTRLLDVTLNPLSALFFACKENFERDGQVVQIAASNKILKYYDSDAVSCVANLSHLNGRLRNTLRQISQSSLNKIEAGKQLLHYIKREKSYFCQIFKRVICRAYFS